MLYPSGMLWGRAFLSLLVVVAISSFNAPSACGDDALIPTGKVSTVSFYSSSLRTRKKFRIYLPPGYTSSQDRYPVVYFFRGLETEWFNPKQDQSRKGKSLKDTLDSLILKQTIGPMIVVAPSTSSDDGTIPAPGINMFSVELASNRPGVGSGQFESYLAHDLVRYVDSHYRTLPSEDFRGVDGFSLGGYTAVVLALKHPDIFTSVGSYDGTHMWYNLIDPRGSSSGGPDRTWMDPELFDSSFGNPRVIPYMLAYNAANLLRDDCSPGNPGPFRALRFYIQTAAQDGGIGNLDRGRHLVNELARCAIPNQASSLVLADKASHNWLFADLYSRGSLIQHWKNFRAHFPFGH